MTPAKQPSKWASQAADVAALRDPMSVGVQPQTARGERTRANLIAAARTVFERDGYLDSRLVDIAAEAECSIGSFYTWFDGKDEILAAVLLEAQQDLLDPGTDQISSREDPTAAIAASNRAYFAAYERNARIMRIWAEVAAVDPRFRAMRQARSEAFLIRNAKAIHDLQERGLADRGVNAAAAALALSGMVSRLAQDAFLGERRAPTDVLIETATRLWTNALGLTSPQLGTGPL